jgi:hypothetical protein
MDTPVDDVEPRAAVELAVKVDFQRDTNLSKQAAGWYPCRDSNPGTRFRKPLLYPPELQGRGSDEADYASHFGAASA